MNIKESPEETLIDCNDKLICIDLDGTLCHGIWWGEEDQEPEPNLKLIEYIWKLYKKGAHIIIYTARQPRYYAITHAWLIKNQVPFHGIAMTMKPGADCYIDDKSIHPNNLIYE